MHNIHLSDDEDEPIVFPEGIRIQTQAGVAPSASLNIGFGPLPPMRPVGRKAAKEKRKAARQVSSIFEVSSAKAEYAAQLTKAKEVHHDGASIEEV
ncbi:hypothetical protein FRX31_028445 [Thalictrum thalictroides]|uniref:Uncharacterized protein n=1 Tax=Thalictrum thalictroides TaxID=46969 RepID=A0A7J6VCM1_THATH|nr:hypothetical protein FRX31_028445 [Thalictrum thalictroides]